MALTRRMLTAMGIEAEKIDQIIEAHGETVDGLKKQAEELKEQASKVPTLEKEIEQIKAAQPKEDWPKKYKELQDEFDGFKAKVETEHAEAEKARLYRSMLREAGVDEKRIDAILKVTDLGGISVKDGAIENPDSVKQAIAEEWGGFITHTNTQGASVETPPSSTGTKMTRKEIYATDENGRYKMSTAERQRAIAENLDQFR